MVEIKWIKLDTGIFEDEKIKIILAMPEGKSLLLVWLRLLCLAGRLNNSGVLMVNKTLPYTVEMLGAVFGESQQIMSLALDTFKKIGMIEICNGAIFLPNWEKHQAEDALAKIRRNNREAQARHREKQKLTAGEDDVRLLSPYDNGRIMEQREDIDKENRNKRDGIPIPHPYGSDTTVTDTVAENNESSTNRKAKETRHKHGEYKNVLLTDAQLEALKKEYPDWKNRIDRLSEYMESKGVAYKNHFVTIKAWARKDKPKEPERKLQVLSD